MTLIPTPQVTDKHVGGIGVEPIWGGLKARCTTNMPTTLKNCEHPEANYPQTGSLGLYKPSPHFDKLSEHLRGLGFSLRRQALFV